MKVIKRDGRVEMYDCIKIKKAIEFACDGLDVNPLKLEAKFDEFLFDGVTTDAIQTNLILHAKNLATPRDDKWVFVAGRLAVMATWNSTKGYEKTLLTVIREMQEKGVYTHSALNVYTDNEILELGACVDKKLDLQHSISSVLTFKDKYLVAGECIQIVNMVDAMIYASVEKTAEQRMYYAKRWYYRTAHREISKATPHWTGLRFNGNTGSCFVLAVGDSLDSIMDNAKRTAEISKNGGGVGVYFGYVRAKDDMIAGEYGRSGGVTYMMKIYNDVIVAFNQLGKRKGAITVSLPIWHKDIKDFLEVKSEVGDLRTKLFDSQPQVVFCDLFMRMKEEDKNQTWYTFSPYEVERILGFNLNDYSGDEFEDKYWQAVEAYRAGRLQVVDEIPVIALWKEFLKEAIEKGVPYATFGDTLQYSNPNKHVGKIHGLNLCVAPETKILTRFGYQAISDVVGANIDVWNGVEWSPVDVVKTGNNQKLVSVLTSSNQELVCTEYHKWYIQDGFSGSEIIEKRTHELKVGDKLAKFDLPVVQGEKELSHAYTNGFYTGDGCFSGGIQRIFLYHAKRSLVEYMTDVRSVYVDNQQNRTVTTHYGNLEDKYFVPDATYTVKSRLEWLSGLMDSDGSVARNGTNDSLQLSSTKLDFLREVQLMLQTLGVTSKISDGYPEGYREMPKNDGTGESGLYLCNQTWRLLISSSSLFKLSQLGFKSKRLVWSERLPQRNAEQFVTIVDVVDNGRYDDTYCFTEHKRNMGMFNGILTGQCVESSSNFKPDVEAHICSLMSIVVGRCHTKESVIAVARDATRMLANNLSLTKTPVDISQTNLDRYRTIGVGIQGLVDYLALHGLTYDDVDEIAELAELIQYGCILESVELAKERGAYPEFKGSRWDTGEQFDEYIKQSTSPLTDWVWLRGEVKKYGVYLSQHTSPAPNTSTSIAMDAQAGVMPAYAAFFFEDNKLGKIPVTSMHWDKHPLLYSMEFGMYNMVDLTKVIGRMQVWVDTSISAEYLLDKNHRDVSAKYVSDIYTEAWKNKTKAVYYLRTIKKGESAVDKSDECASCAG